MTKVGYTETNVQKYLSFNIRCTVCFSLSGHLLPQQQQTASWWLMFCIAGNLNICSSFISLIQASFIMWMRSEIVGHFSSHPEQSYSLSILFVLTERSSWLFQRPPACMICFIIWLRDVLYIHVANNLIIHKIQCIIYYFLLFSYSEYQLRLVVYLHMNVSFSRFMNALLFLDFSFSPPVRHMAVVLLKCVWLK